MTGVGNKNWIVLLLVLAIGLVLGFVLYGSFRTGGKNADVNGDGLGREGTATINGDITGDEKESGTSVEDTTGAKGIDISESVESAKDVEIVESTEGVENDELYDGPIGQMLPNTDIYVVMAYEKTEMPRGVNLDKVPQQAKTLRFDERLYGTEPFFYGVAGAIQTLDLNGMRYSVSNIGSVNFPGLWQVVAGLEMSRPYNAYAITKYDIVLGDKTETISDFAFNHDTRFAGETFIIPASVTQIGNEPNPVNGGKGMTNHVFYDFGQGGIFREFKVEEREDGTCYFKAVDGILYTGDMRTLVAVPRAKIFAGDVFELPEGVEYLGELSFSRNMNFTELVIDDALKIYTDVAELNTATAENVYGGYYALNKGNSLSAALYGYTDVQRYTVKKSNPFYQSIDGIIYSKDGRHLIAVPHHYQGVIKVAEGCEYWDENALWLDYEKIADINTGITGIVIPESLTDIDDRQLAWINANLKHDVTISEGNKYYARYDFLNGGNILKIEHPADLSAPYVLTDQVKVIDHSQYWIDSESNRIGGAGYNEINTVALAPFILPEGKYQVKISNGWYITVKRSELNGQAMVMSDVQQRDDHYTSGDVFTVTEPDTAIHIDIRTDDAWMADGTLPEGVSISIVKL